MGCIGIVLFVICIHGCFQTICGTLIFVHPCADVDCIGSAFNVKGVMQCPNCRNVENGQWRFANGCSHSHPEFSMDDWYPDEDYFDIYSEMPFRFPWCPFGELARVGSLFEEVESPSTTRREIHGHRAIYAEHAASPSVDHSYFAYVGPLPPPSSRSIDSADDTAHNHHWNNLHGRNETFAPHPFPDINIHYHRSGSHVPGVDPAPIPPGTLRSSQGEPDASTRPRSFPHPLPFEHGPNSRTGSAFVSAIFPRHPVSSGRIHVAHAHHHQQQPTPRPGLATPLFPGIRRGGLPALVPARAHYIFPPSMNPHEPEGPLPSHFHAWQQQQQQHSSGFSITSRGSGWGTYHYTNSASDPSNMSSIFQYRPLS